MTFFAMIGLNILLGMFVPYVLIYALIVQPMHNKRLYGKSKPKRKKKEKESLKSKIGTAVFSVFFLGGMAALAGLTWWWALPHWQDLPLAVIQQYEEKKGMITDIEYEWENGSAKSWGYDYVDLDEESYKFESLELDSVDFGDVVTFHYLKHTKYLMKVSDQEGNIIKHTFSPLSFLIKLLIYFTLTALFFFKGIRSKVSNRNYTKREILTTISFHTFTILIIVISCFTDKITPLFVVMLVHGLMHYIQAKGGIRANIA